MRCMRCLEFKADTFGVPDPAPRSNNKLNLLTLVACAPLDYAANNPQVDVERKVLTT